MENDGKGNFSIVNDQLAPELNNLGMVSDAIFADVDNDGWTDLMVAGEFMPLMLFKNSDGAFKLSKQSNLN